MVIRAFKLNILFIRIISNFRVVWWYFFQFYSSFDRLLCEQTMKTLTDVLYTMASGLGQYRLPVFVKKTLGSNGFNMCLIVQLNNTFKCICFSLNPSA